MNTEQKRMEWIAAICGIIGAMLVALNIGAATIGYCFFLVGAVSYLIVAFSIRNVPLFYLNLVFAITNIIGLVRH